MTTGVEVCSPTVVRRRVALMVRSMRARAGLSLDQAAFGLELTRSSLNRIETGQTRINVHVARSMMDLYDQYEPELLELIRVTRRRGWWQDYQLTDDDYVGWEAGAARVVEFAAARVPQLLRIPDYARAMLTDGAHVGDELAALGVRRGRLGDLVAVSVVVDEAALRNRVGEPAVMRAQFDHLVTCSGWDGVSLRVLPAISGTDVRVSGFRLLDFEHPADPPMVFLDTAAGVIREEGTDSVAAVRQAFAALTAAALSESESRKFITQML